MLGYKIALLAFIKKQVEMLEYSCDILNWNRGRRYRISLPPPSQCQKELYKKRKKYTKRFLFFTIPALAESGLGHGLKWKGDSALKVTSLFSVQSQWNFQMSSKRQYSFLNVLKCFQVIYVSWNILWATLLKVN